MKIENELATIPSGGAYTAWGVTKTAILSNIPGRWRRLVRINFGAHCTVADIVQQPLGVQTLGSSWKMLLSGKKEQCCTWQDSSSQGSPFLTDCRKIPRRYPGSIGARAAARVSAMSQEHKTSSSQWLQSTQSWLSHF